MNHSVIYLLKNSLYRSVVTPRKPPEQIPVLPRLEGVWQLKNSRDICTPVANQERGQPRRLRLLVLFPNLWGQGSSKLRLHRMKWKRPKLVYVKGQYFRRKGIGRGTCCLCCTLHPVIIALWLEGSR